MSLAYVNHLKKPAMSPGRRLPARPQAVRPKPSFQSKPAPAPAKSAITRPGIVVKSVPTPVTPATPRPGILVKSISAPAKSAIARPAILIQSQPTSAKQAEEPAGRGDSYLPANDPRQLTPDESSPPYGYQGLKYGSAPSPDIVPPAKDQAPYILATVPTRPEALKMHDLNVGNMFNDAWRQVTAMAAQANGGLGTARDGYLAYSKKLGFVRMYNQNLTPEQNRKLAAVSLQTGWAIENLPTRTDDSSFKNPECNTWVEKFLAKYEDKLGKFVQDPAHTEIKVKDGVRTFLLKLADPEKGIYASLTKKGHNGFRGFVEGHVKEISAAMAVLAVAAPVLAPMVGMAAGTMAFGAQAVGVGAQAIAGGKITPVQVGTLAVGAMGVSSIAGAVGSAALTETEVALGNTLVSAGADLAQNGRLTAADIAGVGMAALKIPAITNAMGLGGFSEAQLRSLGAGLGVGADLIDNHRLTGAGLAAVAAPLLADQLTGSPALDRAIENGIQLAAVGVQAGRVTPLEVLGALSPLFGGALDREGNRIPDRFKPILDRLTDDPATRQSVWNAMVALATRAQAGTVELPRLLQIAAPFIKQYAQDYALERTA